jgi:hypothetical protein
LRKEPCEQLLDLPLALAGSLGDEVLVAVNSASVRWDGILIFISLL